MNNFDLENKLSDLKFKYQTINDAAKSFESKLQATRAQLDQLKAENEKLKEKLKSFVVADKWVHPEVLALKKHQYCAGMDEDCITGTVACQQKECKIRDYPKFKQALDDIEKFINVCKSTDICTHCQYSEERFDSEPLDLDPLNNVQNIINKAKDGEQ